MYIQTQFIVVTQERNNRGDKEIYKGGVCVCACACISSILFLQADGHLLLEKKSIYSIRDSFAYIYSFVLTHTIHVRIYKEALCSSMA